MPHVEMPQAEFKVVVLGDSHIGKTSLVTRFAEGYYRENSRPATVGAFFVTKRILASDDTPTKIQIWDTAGADSFRAMAPMFYKNAAAVIVCYDVTRRESFEGMRVWLDEVRGKVKVGGEVVVAIAGLKTDLLQDGRAVVPEHEVEQLAEALGVVYLPTSAKTDRNVQALFQCVADRVLQIRQQNGGVMNGAAMNSGGHDISVNIGNQSYPSTESDERIKIISPRRRDQFDKYYVANDPDNTNNSNRDGSASTLDDALITPEKSKKHQRKTSSAQRPGTPSTTCTDEGELIATAEKKKKKGKKDGIANLCADDPYYTCHPVACGAGDGSSGCTVQ